MISAPKIHKPLYHAVCQTGRPGPLSRLGIRCVDQALVEIDYLTAAQQFELVPMSLALEVSRQLVEYFKGTRTEFTFPLHAGGTVFQQRVWQALMQIPYGTTMTYGALARELHSSARAVGNACRANPIPIVIPCHRVVGASGIGGYSGETTGDGIAIKRWLLEHEQAGIGGRR
ncbi:MAG: methylated-DNA--[protein]-cysteine S-methyltransferase [Pseudomonadota bacterium]